MKPRITPGHRPLVMLAAALALGTAGCPSMPMMTTAKTLGSNKAELTISPVVGGYVNDDKEDRSIWGGRV
ncbi:MAG: hypothetical protein EXR75_15370 [Myxococcales bacterium]|nr:hypothetical protein [Myxococcales bacterium]